MEDRTERDFNYYTQALLTHSNILDQNVLIVCVVKITNR